MTVINTDLNGVHAKVNISHDLDESSIEDILIAYGDAVRNLFAQLLEAWAENINNVNKPIGWHEGILDAANILIKAEMVQNPMLFQEKDEDEQAL